jgi:hypothetical protein
MVIDKPRLHGAHKPETVIKLQSPWHERGPDMRGTWG